MINDSDKILDYYKIFILLMTRVSKVINEFITEVKWEINYSQYFNITVYNYNCGIIVQYFIIRIIIIIYL